MLDRRFPRPLLKHIPLEMFARGSNCIFQSSNNLIWKQFGKAEQANQEFLATQLARILLAEKIRPPMAWGVIDNYFISETFTCPQFDRTSPEHIKAATDYLVELHRAEILEPLRRELIAMGYSFNYGKQFRSRLYKITERVKYALNQKKETLTLGKRFDLITSNVLREWSFEANCVLGHGDFQGANLFVSPERVWAIDWVDFGLCDRAYELAHFYDCIPAKKAALVLSLYGEKTGQNVDILLQRGSVLDGIIRMGSLCQKLFNPKLQDDLDKLIFKLSRQIDRMEHGITQLS